MATPLTIRSFRGGQQSNRGGEFGRWAAASNRSSSATCTYAYLGSSPSSSPPSRGPYLTLGLTSDASMHDIKKAYRRLALKYHPDVCKGDSCSNKFMQINDAYETVMGFLEGNNNAVQQYSADSMAPEPMMGVYDESWDEWEEWMGWEGAGTRDYSTHVNHSL
ncbi:hypothetical protein GOP47_0018570 [Adiantum capillus-veneris]|uniref:J domain-containing protein n=1 Tax=Adiantum capillus-veneris TaxID=13818 RepID=A0A9D4UDH0_ADICA|nr:hypothetical protein GOP47_0018570 [Adiantum capillus-veneris]